ncbi:hypothetical protein CYMTET_24113 [Cymbomonas tetramitiformis]|uniref:Aspartic peptidase DDI1-type domain-containing protein n=1 Tax=Cymbomonas tetramitiformis TaxID=36881 RepID=A0AAE0FWI7_9CHLO|nr:hypothetical protein CYMTET_24113 [Cymbomonas tetramitiformis]
MQRQRFGGLEGRGGAPPQSDRELKQQQLTKAYIDYCKMVDAFGDDLSPGEVGKLLSKHLGQGMVLPSPALQQIHDGFREQRAHDRHAAAPATAATSVQSQPPPGRPGFLPKMGAGAGEAAKKASRGQAVERTARSSWAQDRQANLTLGLTRGLLSDANFAPDLLCFTLHILGQQVKAMVDTGSVMTSLSPHTALRCGLLDSFPPTSSAQFNGLLDTSFSGPVGGVGGGSMQLGRIHYCKAQLQDGSSQRMIDIELPFTVIHPFPAADFDCILGLDTLHNLDASLSTRSRTLRLGAKNTAIALRGLKEPDPPAPGEGGSNNGDVGDSAANVTSRRTSSLPPLK